MTPNMPDVILSSRCRSGCISRRIISQAGIDITDLPLRNHHSHSKTRLLGFTGERLVHTKLISLDGEHTRQVQGPPWRSAVFSPDGQEIAVTTSAGITIYNLELEPISYWSPEGITTLHRGGFHYPWWSIWHSVAWIDRNTILAAVDNRLDIMRRGQPEPCVQSAEVD